MYRVAFLGHRRKKKMKKGREKGGMEGKREET